MVDSPITHSQIMQGSNTKYCHTVDSMPTNRTVELLQPKPQAGDKIDWWRPQSIVGVYPGPPPADASTIHLILSLTTRHV